MNLEQFAYFAEIVGVVLVIASLIYVAKQLRQTTEALHAQSRQTVMTGAQAELRCIIDNPDIIKCITKAGTLTPDEHIKLHAFLLSALRSREFAWLQYRNGQIDETQWNTELAVLRILLSSPRSRLWWEKLGRDAHSNEFAEFVDKAVQNRPATDYFEAQENWTGQ